MKKSTLTLLAAAALAGLAFTPPAQSAPALPGIDRAADELATLERAAYMYRGREYCFYGDGWHGPGWYWCGYAFRRGYGWGGMQGWRGWYWGPRPGPAPHRRYWSHGRWHYR